MKSTNKCSANNHCSIIVWFSWEKVAHCAANMSETHV